MPRKKVTKKTSKVIASLKVAENKLINMIALLGLWLTFCLAILSFLNFSWLAPGFVAYLPFHQSWGAALVLLAGMFLFLRFFVKTQDVNETKRDVPFWVALIVLIGASTLGVYLCLYHMNLPLGGYSQDSSFDLQIRHWIDLSDYRNAFITERGLLPVWPYAACAFWSLLPNETGLWIQRFTGAFFDLGTIWIFYLIGKEIAGRRMGILAAALTAVSKPLLSRVVSGYSSSCLIFGIALALWLSIRLVRKNTTLDFLIWGAGIGFLAYTSAPVEPFVPFFIFIGLIWVGWTGRKELKLNKIPPYVWITTVLFIPYFLCCVNAFSSSMTIIRSIKSLSILWVTAVLVFSCYLLFQIISGKDKSLWAKWFLGAWAAAFLSFPGMTNEFIIERIGGHSLVEGVGFLSPVYFEASFQRLPATLQWLFWACIDRPDMGLAGDSLFSYSETILIGLGVVFCLAKPSSVRVLLFLTAILGVAPHFFANSNHSGLLIGCVAPLLVIAAIGLNELLEMIFQAKASIVLNATVCILLTAFWAWSAQGVFSRIYTQWADKPSGYVLPRQEIIDDAGQGHRVYISNQMFDSSAVLYEGSTVRLWHKFNVVYLETNEKAPDVDIYFSNTQDDIRKILVKAFPKAVWKKVCYPSEPDTVQFWHCEIPSEQFEKKNNGLLYVVRLPKPFWRRTYMVSGSALNLSLVNWEDGAVDINAPISPEANVILGDQTVKLDGDIQVENSGDYEIVCKTHNRTKVFIDNKQLFNIRFLKIGDYISPVASRKLSLHLDKGAHHVEVLVSFQIDSNYPDITLRSLSSNEAGKSIWKSFIF